MEYDDLEIIEDELDLKKQSKLNWLINNYRDIPMTYILVAINVLVFLLIHLTNIFIEDNWFIFNFAKISYSIAIDNEYFRLFTPIFMHESITHLAFNCMAIVFLGKPVEQIFGKYKLLFIFLVSGLFGSLSSFIFSESISIGASGGVFGFFGVHMYLYLKNKSTYLKVFGKDMLQLLVINVIIGFTLPNIDFWAHFGGILGGFLACNSVGLSKDFKFNKNLFIVSLTTLILFSSLFIYFKNQYINYSEYITETIDIVNEFAQVGNIDELKNIRTTLSDEKLILPPSSQTERIVEFIDDYIIKYE